MHLSTKLSTIMPDVVDNLFHNFYETDKPLLQGYFMCRKGVKSPPNGKMSEAKKGGRRIISQIVANNYFTNNTISYSKYKHRF